MSDTSTKAKNLLMRDLTEEVNDGLEWGKTHFQVNTNTAAAEKLITNYRTVYQSLNIVIRQRDDLKDLVDQLLMEIDSKEESEKNIKDLIGRIGKLEEKY